MAAVMPDILDSSDVVSDGAYSRAIAATDTIDW